GAGRGRRGQRPRGQPRPRRPAGRGPAGAHGPGQLPALPARGPERRGAGMRQRTVVVGGGLAGLLAARRRQRAGDQVLVLEQEAAVGGAIAADQVAGLELNIGAEAYRSEEHTSELQSRFDLVCRLLLEKKKNKAS